MTRRKSDFAIVIPSDWTEREDEGVWHFDAPDGSDQVVVQCLRARNVMDAASRSLAVDELYDAREQGLAALSDGLGVLFPAGYETGDGRVALSFVGKDGARGVLIYGRIVAVALKIVIVSYYRFVADAEATDFVAAAQRVCASLHAVEAGD